MCAFASEANADSKVLLTAGQSVHLEGDRQTGALAFLFPSHRQAPQRIVIPPIEVNGVQQANFAAGDGPAWQNDSVILSLEKLSNRAIAIEIKHRKPQAARFRIRIRDNSHYYGCGERFNALNQKGFIVPMASIDRPEPKGSISYKPVPFIMSTRGYALWANTDETGTFDLNATVREEIHLNYTAKKLRLVLIAGPAFGDLLNEFTRLTGRPQVPPPWAFAPWKSRDVHRNREDILEDIERHRRDDLPASVLVIDSPWETGYNNFILNEQQFKNPKPLFARVRELGFYPCFWLTPFINSKNLQDMQGIERGASSNYAEAESKGYLVKQPDGKPYSASWWKGEGGLVDFTNPRAVEWWKQELKKTLPWGIRAIKCDDGEGNFIDDAVFHDGTPASQMRNRYSLLYLEAAQAFLDESCGGGVLAARSGYTGMQRFPFCWAGDNEANFSDANGFPSVVIAAQTAALSGIPFWGSDIAGYIGKPSKELFIRWTQFGAFSPMMMVHMTSNLGPWDFDEQALNIYRRFAKLHTQLFPYIEAAARESAATGMPIIRPMVLAFPDDWRAASRQYQYMFGPDLLVAPMVRGGTHRKVYLPAGTWVNYWDGTTHEGPKDIEQKAPLNQVPLFVRGGAIIEMLPADVDTLIERHPQMSNDVVAIDMRRVFQLWRGGTSRTCSLESTIGLKLVERDHKLVIVNRQPAGPPRKVEIRLMHCTGPDLAKGHHERVHEGNTCIELTVGPEPVTINWQR